MQKNFCCTEKPEKSYKSEVHSIPAVSNPAPSWKGIAVRDLRFEELSLDKFKGKYVVLLFYPYDFTFVCPTELIQFSDRAEDFRKIGAEVVAISTDSEFVHLAWIVTPRKQGGLGEIKIPVLTDRSHEISRKYGVLDEERGVSLKALFVIDQKQLIRHVTINEKSLRRSVDEVLRIIENCQFVDKYGDTCPAGPLNCVSEDEINYFSTT